MLPTIISPILCLDFPLAPLLSFIHIYILAKARLQMHFKKVVSPTLLFQASVWTCVQHGLLQNVVFLTQILLFPQTTRSILSAPTLPWEEECLYLSSLCIAEVLPLPPAQQMAMDKWDRVKGWVKFKDYQNSWGSSWHCPTSNQATTGNQTWVRLWH